MRGKRYEKRGKRDDRKQNETGLPAFHFPLSTFLHHLFNLLNRIHGLIIYLIHITLWITRGIAFKLTFIEGTHKLTDGHLVNLPFSQTLADIIMG